MGRGELLLTSVAATHFCDPASQRSRVLMAGLANNAVTATAAKGRANEKATQTRADSNRHAPDVKI